ncbi:hypothetical protein ACI3DN_00920 [Sellimonas catena]|uniref:Uncharacterized protein n=1 Tax=Sellimonas catena TaxID=2994035 RepID=A0A9W6FDU2_9FIRM|nr:hypothetical protein [Sellimonas catena]GLG06352.1 hypothetical protein Selli1_35260 [Sellimonas catena]
MNKIFRLEAYHWDKDYWSVIGIFMTRDLAQQGKELVEKENANVSCSIFESEVINTPFDITK